jgi:hypothetical protein
MVPHHRLALLVLVAGCVDLSHPVGLGMPYDQGGATGSGGSDAAGLSSGGMGGLGTGGSFPPDLDALEPIDLGLPDQPAPPVDSEAPGDVTPPIDVPGSQPDATIDLAPEAGPPAVPPALLSNGAVCSSAMQCASAQCVDGVCCATACGASCHSCNLAGTPGTCTPVPSGQDPRNECPAQAASTCQRLGQCNGQGACRLHPAGTVCGPGACSGAVETFPTMCNGSGSCLFSGFRACGNYQCNGTTCSTSCSNASQCKAGLVCFASKCVAAGSPPLLLWRFDEGGGSIAQDESGNGYHGSYTGISGAPATSTVVPTLKFANPRSRSFIKGNRQAVHLPNMPAAFKPANNITVTAWYRATSVDNTPPVASSEIVTGGDNYALRVRETDVQFAKHTATRHEKVEGVVGNQLDGNWHHVAGVTTSSGMKIYFDGVERGSNNIGDPILYDRGDDLFVGRHGNGQEFWDFDGNIDEVRVYTRALSAAEIAELAAGGN